MAQRFSIDASEPGVGAAVERACARIRGARVGARMPAEAAWTALAALAIGDHQAGCEAVRALGDRLRAGSPGADGAAPDSDAPLPSADAFPLYLLLVARCFAWTADHALLLDEWPRIERALAAGGSADTPVAGLAGRGAAQASGVAIGGAPAPGVPGAALRVAALRELAEVARDIGRPADASKLVHAARDLGASDSEIDPATALALGSAPPDIVAEWVRVQSWRSEGGTAAVLDEPIHAAIMVAALIHGVLGAQPDAARQRLALRPCLPERWTSIRVGNLRVGDAVIVVRHTADGTRQTFTFEQVAGAVPLRLAFEPVLPAASARIAAEVDGAAAELDARPSQGRVIVPVQLVLDHERTVSFAFE